MTAITRVAPMLGTHDLQKTIDFYTKLLGFTLNGTWPEAEPTWCNLSSGDATLMFSTYGADGALEMSGSLYLYPDDVDALWERVKDHAEVDAPLRDTEYGMREFVVHDPNGYHLAFGAPMAQQ
jgi:uncharacterized glyoxalase superfamily protein PhnB